MGRLMRCFWLPAMTSAEIPECDQPPVKLRLLGENLVVFRDTNGRVGVLEENCPHRGASLYFGRNEECGLRCVYHGWKFDVTGQCVDLPTESASSPMKARMRAVSYASKEAGGVLWVFMGDQANIPDLPGFEWFEMPESHRYVSRWEQECNYAQAMEGELDSAHVGFLHRLVGEVDKDDQALTGGFFQEDTAPKWRIVDTAGGFIAANERRVGSEKSYWRLNQFLLPFYTMIPPRDEDALLVRMWVPMDDEHCWVLCVTFRPDRPVDAAERRSWMNGENSHRKVIPGTTQPTQRKSNDYLIDRELQRIKSFTGIAGIRTQDAMVTETAGPIVDRTREHLGSSDRAVVAMRGRLMDAARALVDDRTLPAAASQPAAYRVRAVQSVIARDVEPDFTSLEKI
jgi:phenylpropionate dioxygenase-like ring-hydroxylating dioxygenase large terminal subunit